MRTGECVMYSLYVNPDRYVMDCDAIAEKMITVVCLIYKVLWQQENMFYNM